MAPVIAALLLLLSARDARAQAAAMCVLPPNAVVKENCLLGRQSDFWAGDGEENGLTVSRAGASAGQLLRLTADMPAKGATVEIYRLGHYAAFGARLIARITPADGAKAIDIEWRVPSDALSGIYLARLSGRRREARAAFVVHEEPAPEDARPRRDVLVIVGGDGCAPRLRCVFSREQPLLRWLERNGFDAAYVDAAEAERDPRLLRRARVLATAADDSLWPAGLRAAVDAARAEGAALALLGGPGSADPAPEDGIQRPLVVAAAAADEPLWRHTEVAELAEGATASFPELAGPRLPAEAPKPTLERGAFFTRAARWVWGLDNRHDGGGREAARRAIRQATLNALVDLGAVPGALEPGLKPASAPPTARSRPRDGAGR